MRVNPVVVLSGARQTGKSTIATQFAQRDRRPVHSLDDAEVRTRVREDPLALLNESPTLVLDEVQREPDLMLAIKRAVDQMGTQRVPGRFLLTGSANLLLMKQVADSLAGRASYVTIHPLTRRELLGLGTAGSWTDLLESEPESWPDVLDTHAAPADDWQALARQGGFPVPAYWLESPEQRDAWFRGYESTYLERDLRDLSAVQNIPDFRRLLRAACLRIGNLTNQTELGRDIQLNQPSVHRYLSLLETTFQLVRLPAFSGNRTVRLIKAPKLYWVDTAAALYLAREPEPRGAHLENLILNDLLAWRDAHPKRADVMYWRTAGGREIDFVIDAGSRLLPIEVKATSNPVWSDATVLHSFVKENGASAAGLLLHTGDRTFWIATGVLAAPWWRVI